jgi:F-type H+-transporting ATPase subunit gamma
MKVRPRNTVEVLILTSDKGLCGAFNANVIKAGVSFINQLRSENFKVSISVVGKKADHYFKRRNIPLRKVWTRLSGRITYTSAQEVAGDLMESYLAGEIDEVHIVYNEFKSVIAQKVTHTRLLPLGAIDHGEDKEKKVYLFEPDEAMIFNNLLPKSVEIQVYRAMLESQAAEEAARMTAMENATKNAEEMIDRLTLEYNKARQASITKELMDIVGGAEALKE